MDKGYNVQSTYSSTRSVYTFKPQRMRHLGYFALKKKKNYYMIKNFSFFSIRHYIAKLLKGHQIQKFDSKHNSSTKFECFSRVKAKGNAKVESQIQLIEIDIL